MGLQNVIGHQVIIKYCITQNYHSRPIKYYIVIIILYEMIRYINSATSLYFSAFKIAALFSNTRRVHD